MVRAMSERLKEMRIMHVEMVFSASSCVIQETTDSEPILLIAAPLGQVRHGTGRPLYSEAKGYRLSLVSHGF